MSAAGKTDAPFRAQAEGPTSVRARERPICWRFDLCTDNWPTRDRYREDNGPDFNRWPDKAPRASLLKH